MMAIEKFLLIAIDSTHFVMKVEKLLLDNNFDVRIIPLPKEIKVSCGLSIKANLNDSEKIKNILFKNGIEKKLYTFYIIEKNGFNKEIIPFN